MAGQREKWSDRQQDGQTDERIFMSNFMVLNDK
jgi:hypothetical protein